MKIKSVLASLLALIIIASLCSVCAYAANDTVPATPEQIAEKLQLSSFTSASGYVINYGIYRSSAYSASDTDKPAMLLLYFHGEDGKGDLFNEKGLLGLLLADKTDSLYNNFSYIIVAPQCPEGESFAGLTEAGEFAENTELFDAVKGLAANIEATNIVLEKHTVIGVGTGATAAFAYASQNTVKVNRVLTVGGECNESQTAQIYDSGVDFWCFAENGNKSIKALQERVKSYYDGDLAVNFAGDSLDQCVSAAISMGEPTVPEWVIKDAYTSRKFRVSANCTDGGKISVSPSYATYGGSASITLTVSPGYIITSANINEEEIDIAEFVRIGATRQYKYEINDITSDRILSVKLERFSNATSHGKTIDKIMTTLSVVSGVLVVAAITVYVITLVSKREKPKK